MRVLTATVLMRPLWPRASGARVATDDGRLNRNPQTRFSRSARWNRSNGSHSMAWKSGDCCYLKFNSEDSSLKLVW